MTIELTPEQAAVLRVASMNVSAYLDSEYANLVPSAFEWSDVFGVEGLSDAGHEALARYDAKYRIVEVATLSALIEFAEGELECIDGVYAGYPRRLAEHDWLRDAVAKAKEALK